MALMSYFFKYDKRPNSLKAPALNTGTQIVIRIKDDSSVLNPVLTIKKTDSNVFDFNYCYIPSFKRFYFIDDVILAGELWEIYTHCDVLASYRTDIINSKQYVARSSSNYDGQIIDSLYLTKCPALGNEADSNKYDGLKIGGVRYPDYVNVTDASYSVNKSVAYFNQAITSGYFVVGIVGPAGNGTGMTYYAMQYSAFKKFINQAVTLNPTDMADVSSGLANAIFDPITYITSCRWYPDVTLPSSVPTVSNIEVGRYTVGLAGGSAYVLNKENVARYYLSIDLPTHPNMGNRHYLNLAPFTESTLHFEPFGNIPLDSSKIINLSKIWVEWDVDYCSGAAILKVLRNNPYSYQSDRALISYSLTDYGVNIPISGLTYGLEAGVIMSGLQFIKQSYESSMSKGRSKPAYMSDYQYSLISQGENTRAAHNVELLNSVIDAAGSALGQLKTVGASGSFIGYNSGVPAIYNWYMDQTTYDDSRFGRPLYQTMTLSSLSGFCLCLDASITSFTNKPLSTEYQQIISYLNDGVYLE